MNPEHLEAERLLAILRGHWAHFDRLAERFPVRAEIFLALCKLCDVHPTVHALLERERRLERLGTEASSALTQLRKKCRQDNLLLLAAVERALDLLAAAGIHPVVLKGLAVVERFGIGFDERTLDDADLLVAPEIFPRALAVLEDAGWRAPQGAERQRWLRESYQIPLWSPDPIPAVLELHWGLAQDVRYRLQVREVLRRVESLQVSGRRAWRLEDHDAVAHLLLHHLQHYFDRRLKWALDLWRLAEREGFDWTAVGARLERWGGRAAAGAALVHLERWFPGRLPEPARRALPPPKLRLALALPLRSRHPLDLFRHRATRRRWVQLYLAGLFVDRARDLLRYTVWRRRRARLSA